MTDNTESVLEAKERFIHGTPIKIYQAIHHWLRKNYGKPIKCEKPDCKKQSKTFNWALVRGRKYQYKRANFISLCRSCHAIYDVTEVTREKNRVGNARTHQTHCLRGHLFSGSNLRTITLPNGKVRRTCRKCVQDNTNKRMNTETGKLQRQRYNKKYKDKVRHHPKSN